MDKTQYEELAPATNFTSLFDLPLTTAVLEFPWSDGD